MQHAIVTEFMEDAAAALAGVTQRLQGVSGLGDAEQLNALFRAAHAVKNGAASLGLIPLHDLAHAVERVVECLREQPLPLEPPTATLLENAFADLERMVADAATDAPMAVSAQQVPLVRLLQDHLPEPMREEVITLRELRHPGSQGSFHVSEYDLRQAHTEGNYLYWIEYDLIRDAQFHEGSVFECMRFLEKSGRILDCRIRFGEADEDRLPVSLLYATILEQELVLSIVQLSHERVLCIPDYATAMTASQAPLTAAPCASPDALQNGVEGGAQGIEAVPATKVDTMDAYDPQVEAQPEDDSPATPSDTNAPSMPAGVFLVGPPTRCTMHITGDAGVERAEALRTAMLAALEYCHVLDLDCSQVEAVDVTFLQLLWGMWLSARNRGVAISCIGISDSLRQAITLCGLERAMADSYGLGAFPCVQPA